MIAFSTDYGIVYLKYDPSKLVWYSLNFNKRYYNIIMYTTSSIDSDLLISYNSIDYSPDEPPTWLNFGQYEFGKLEPKMQVKLITQ